MKVSERPESQEQSSAGDVVPGVGSERGPLSRRALMRAGLKAAPIVMTLKTDMVLATTTSGSTVRPSAFSSFVANGFRCSAGPAKSGKATGKFLTRDQCKSLVVTTTMYFKYKYHSHSEGWNGCGFVKPSVRFSGCSTDNPKLDWIIRTLNPQNDRDRLGLYCAMAYMAAKYYGDAECFITEANCRTIWKNNGVWTVGGVQRDLAWTLAYFNQVYGANAFDACLKGA